eukprot:comp10806_c0_seq1/m.5436 comp10806_c0_seq1/g.5436  ORF comp10806_c0_seq1/g.5436 comp10806_c0_seq1/m.5436 type:complete len:169 (-) comp10806_c0_seq1:439-945(-)
MQAPAATSTSPITEREESSFEYTSVLQRKLVESIARQLAQTGKVDGQTLEKFERNLFVESATALLMAEAQSLSDPDLINVLENLRALHMAIIVTFMPYPPYHKQARKWINEYFKENQVYCAWVDTQENTPTLAIPAATASPTALAYLPMLPVGVMPPLNQLPRSQAAL